MGRQQRDPKGTGLNRSGIGSGVTGSLTDHLSSRQVWYEMFFDMKAQAREVCVAPDRSIIAIHSPGKPLWLWLRDGWRAERLRTFFDSYLQNLSEPLVGLAAEREAALLCAEMYINHTNAAYISHEMIAYYLGTCYLNVSREYGKKAVENTKGFLRPATAKDAPFLTEWITCFYREALKTPPPFEDEAVRPNQKRAAKDHLYIWQAGSLIGQSTGQPVAMGMLCCPGEHTQRLNLIYTPEPLRRHGYAKQMVNALAGLAFENECTPVLYAAESNKPANCLYRSLGFREAGRLTEVIFILEGTHL